MSTNARDGSVIVRVGRTVADRMRTAIDRSRLGSLSHSHNDSHASESEETTATPSPSVLERIASGSALRSAMTATKTRVQPVASSARLTALGETCYRYATSSFGYRWLTTEPEPDVIVIDLRETNAIGPFLDSLDRVLDGATGAMPTSAVTEVVTRVGTAVRDRPLAAASVFALPTVAVSLIVLGLSGSLDLPLLGVHLAAAVLAVLGLRSRRSLDDLLEMQAVQLLVAVFEPPEPPATEMRTDEPDDE
ncbi:hypothetical protein [Natrinema longum]|uniref:Uncharacterized protein n=1 Tax=Natrinema longum TaxID=370324 RepID=A0A8A2UA28_9EURY|nr:hypothetical protein [Natrinema longum]MBZ6496475.1 hypothetical protein [Natrinema longum]QSW85619.1 hypothetical protein J0X27_01890 [Natrinema longum]